MSGDQTTLGDSLSPRPAKTAQIGLGTRLACAFYTLLNITLLTTIFTLPVWWVLMEPTVNGDLVAALALLIAVWLFVAYRTRACRSPRKAQPLKPHPLLANDRQGFMQGLKLGVKTAIIDGSNIYHFGRANKLDAQPLGMIAEQLRREGYRIVCFFDANIFYTLSEHEAFPNKQAHTFALLDDIFGLEADEIYIVPSGIQADGYILESLKHLPLSFVVTNDRYRDYARKYPTVMKGNLWRKGVVISKNEIKLLQHRFQNPVYLSQVAAPDSLDRPTGA